MSNSNMNEKLTKQELIQRFAEIHKISYEEAEQRIGAPTEEEILKNIEHDTYDKINSTLAPMNRKQRRALKKKMGAKKYAEFIAGQENPTAAIAETAEKLDYINLIQKLRELNNKKENERNEDTNEDD